MTDQLEDKEKEKTTTSDESARPASAASAISFPSYGHDISKRPISSVKLRFLGVALLLIVSASAGFGNTGVVAPADLPVTRAGRPEDRYACSL